MQVSRAILKALCLSTLFVAPVLMAKDAKKAKAVKECEDKGGHWDKKKKACAVEKKEAAPEEAAAPAPMEDETAEPK